MNADNDIPSIKERSSFLPIHLLPQNERQFGIDLASELSRLTSYVVDFRAALLLFDRCLIEEQSRQQARPRSPGRTSGSEDRDISEVIREIDAYSAYVEEVEHFDEITKIHSDWRAIAIRDGAMTIFHFGRTIESARALSGLCKAWSDIISREHLKAAGQLFGLRFPDFVKLRHSVAHRAEVSSPKQIDTHTVRMPAATSSAENSRGGLFMNGVIWGRNYNATFEGKIVSYELSEASLSALDEVRCHFYDAFASIEPSW